MNEKYMNEAYKEALKASKNKDIPVGAIIVYNNKIIARSHNNRQKNSNILGHAEINSILKAEKRLKDWRLDQCEMYVTLEPCKLCEYVILESRIKNVYYLLKNENIEKKHQKFIQTNDCITLKNSYEKLIKIFFKNLRK